MMMMMATEDHSFHGVGDLRKRIKSFISFAFAPI